MNHYKLILNILTRFDLPVSGHPAGDHPDPSLDADGQCHPFDDSKSSRESVSCPAVYLVSNYKILLSKGLDLPRGFLNSFTIAIATHHRDPSIFPC